jgi:hypothetical protein
VVDLFDRFLDSHRLRGSRLPEWRRGSLSCLAHWRSGSLPRLVRGQQGSLLFGREGFRSGLNRLGRFLRRCERLLAGGSGCSRPAPSASATAASAASRGLRCSRSFRRYAFHARFRFGIHVHSKLPSLAANAMGIMRPPAETTLLLPGPN